MFVADCPIGARTRPGEVRPKAWNREGGMQPMGALSLANGESVPFSPERRELGRLTNIAASRRSNASLVDVKFEQKQFHPCMLLMHVSIDAAPAPLWWYHGGGHSLPVLSRSFLRWLGLHGDSRLQKPEDKTSATVDRGWLASLPLLHRPPTSPPIPHLH